jgi:hypothetical protein
LFHKWWGCSLPTEQLLASEQGDGSVEQSQLFIIGTGPYYPLGNIGAVPRAYEGMEESKNKKINEKYKNVI